MFKKDKFLEAFKGKRLRITNLDRTAGIQGYLIDVDEENYYLGDTPTEVTHYMRRENTLGEIFEEKKSVKKKSTKDRYDTQLDEFDIDDDKFKIN